nr:FkbM family methyltransferase [Ketobacter sp. MCCC 1A13808]
MWKEHGFYLDCGAYHSRSMSMTARLRLFGWTGVNIDIDHEVVSSLEKDIPGVKSVCAALSAEDGSEVYFYKYGDPVLNTIYPAQHEHLQKIEKNKELFTSYKGKELIKTTSLRTVLEAHSIENNVDFLNLDVEGVELDVLEGFPWEKQCPSVIAIEIHRLSLNECAANPIVKFMAKRGYVLQSYVFHTAVFCREDFDVEQCHRVAAKRI